MNARKAQSETKLESSSMTSQSTDFTPSASEGMSIDQVAPTQNQANLNIPFGSELLVGVKFMLTGAERVRIDGLEVVDMKTVADEAPRYQPLLQSARNRIARAAKVPSATLPIIFGIDKGEVLVGIATPIGKDPGPIVTETQELCAAIVEQWRRTAELAKSALIGGHRSGEVDKKVPGDKIEVSDSSSTNQSVNSTSTDQEDQGAESGPTIPVQTDPMNRRLMEALLDRENTGTLSLNFNSAGNTDEEPPLIVPPSPPLPNATIKLTAPYDIEAQVRFRTGAAACLIRETDATIQRRATFSTTDKISTLINILAACPPVKFEVREFTSDQPRVEPANDYQIDRLKGLTEAWLEEPSVVDHLQSCIDDLRNLLNTLKAK